MTVTQRQETHHSRASRIDCRPGVRLAGLLIVALALLIGGCASQYRTVAQDTSTDPAVEARDYTIGPEDLLHISVWNEENLDREVLVRPDGGISFPLAGNVEAAGKTVPELQAELTQQIREYIPNAVVTVGVEEVAGYTIYVIGEVNEPGQYTLAGGLTPYASGDEIKILRRGEGGEEIVLPFDYSEVQSGVNLDQNVTLRSGDTIVVP